MTSGFGESAQSGFRHAPSGIEALTPETPQYAKLKVGPGGRVVIPAALREKLGVSEGDQLMATLENGELRLVSLAESVRRAQAMVRKVVPAGVSLVDELLADRRREVEQDRSEAVRQPEKRRG